MQQYTNGIGNYVYRSPVTCSVLSVLSRYTSGLCRAKDTKEYLLSTVAFSVVFPSYTTSHLMGDVCSL